MFYAAYVYFEKLRIREGEEKSEKREDVEDIHRHGLTRELLTNTRYVCGKDYEVVGDEYGCIRRQRICWRCKTWVGMAELRCAIDSILLLHIYSLKSHNSRVYLYKSCRYKVVHLVLSDIYPLQEHR